MRKLLISALIGAASLAAAVPALAAPFAPRPPVFETRFAAPDIDQRIANLSSRIDFAQRRGFIGFREARHLRDQLSQVRFMEQRDRFRNGGRLSPMQAMQLNRQLDRVSGRLRG